MTADPLQPLQWLASERHSDCVHSGVVVNRCTKASNRQSQPLITDVCSGAEPDRVAKDRRNWLCGLLQRFALKRQYLVPVDLQHPLGEFLHGHRQFGF